MLRFQGLVDRFARFARFGKTPDDRGRRRFLIIQIDGLSREILDRALATRRVPSIARLLRTGRLVRRDLSVGIPSSTPAFQGAIMYGVKPDIPGFHYYDRRADVELHFPEAGVADLVETREFAGRQGILEDGSAYGCVFTGGAPDSLLTFARLGKPTRAGLPLLRLLFSSATLAWVVVKCLGLTVVELGRFIARVATDRAARKQGLKWLGLKIGFSIWIRQLFTLAVSADLYRGLPAIYVNYLDYDVLSHAYGPRHPRALRSLRRIDDAIKQIWRVCRRVPEHRYDLYVLSDHGQAHTKLFDDLAGGRRFERVIFEDFFTPQGARPVSPQRPAGRHHLASGIKALRVGRAPGFFQRFFNYIEDGFPWVLGELKEARERDNVRVICAGPNAFIYFVDDDAPLPIERIEERWPGLAEELSRHPGVGYVFSRGAGGPLCFWRGKRYRLGAEAGPFAGRDDAALVVGSVGDLMRMPSAGDLVVYGIGAAPGHISYIAEAGAHAGPSPEELHTFVVAPPDVRLPGPLNHPVQLYPFFVRYLEDAERESAA